MNTKQISFQWIRSLADNENVYLPESFYENYE
jgi:hypothetical protein